MILTKKAGALWLCLLIVQLFCLSPSSPAKTTDSEQIHIPQELKTWQKWVMYGQESQTCPARFNDSGAHICAWPSRLDLAVDDTQGEFRQDWLLTAQTWLILPGGGDEWPQDVQLNGNFAPVISRGNRPCIKAPAGSHQVTGRFNWPRMPETIHIPAQSGLVKLSISGKPQEKPVFDKNGALWLTGKTKPRKAESTVKLRINRLLQDSIPMLVTTRLSLNLAGEQREISLKDILLPHTIPMRLNSPVPARLNSKGELTLQAKPGRFIIEILARFPGPVNKIGPVKAAFGPEVWAFAAENQLRMVKLNGGVPIDPGQTELPQAWRRYRARVMNPQDTLAFKTLRRGEADPAPDRLTINRTWWLDFNGQGFTVEDRISGVLSQSWRLGLNPPAQLGRVSVSGRDRLITRLTPESNPGVELRQGRLELTAESTMPLEKQEIQAVGWDHDFQKASLSLRLPPGWKLLCAKGVDQVSNSLLKRWSLLDIFLVLIISLAVWRLLNWGWGIITFFGVGLSFHEPAAPQFTWLYLLAALALFRLLPQGNLKRLMDFTRWVTAGLLLVVAIPFIVNQARVGLYPQLERPDYYFTSVAPTIFSLSEDENADMMEKSAPAPAPRMKKAPARVMQAPSKAKVLYRSQQKQIGRANIKRKPITMTDPNALVQTGPGLPDWRWRSVNLSWNGPVDKDHKLRLYLFCPTINLILAWLRVILVAAILAALIIPKGSCKGLLKYFGVACLLAGLLLIPLQKAQAADSAYPPESLLKELKARLLKPHDCFPNCAVFSRMQLKADANELTILLEAQAEIDTAIPLPGAQTDWGFTKVFLNDNPAPGLTRDKNGIMWALVPKGVNRFLLQAKINGLDRFSINLPLRPKKVNVTAPGWEISGLGPRGQAGAALQLKRTNQVAGRSRPESVRLPAFFQVEREFTLGLTWQVNTIIKRLTPTGEPALIRLPILANETVNTPGIKVQNKQVEISLAPKQGQAYFTSSLETIPELKLKAAQQTNWTETWTLKISPIWHSAFKGIPMVARQNRTGGFTPKFRPWPGEELTVNITKPLAVKGRITTIDQARLSWLPGNRFDLVKLSLYLRSSQGGQHTITLPPKARLEQIKIKNKLQPIRPEQGKLTIPLTPGGQKVFLEWRQPGGSFTALRGPQVDLGTGAVNARINLKLPTDRWILWASGPTMGPAVLFWSYLAVIILAGWGLGKTRLTPLKTWQWMLLGLGLTQVHPVMALVVVAWLILLGKRAQNPPKATWFTFNSVQVVLVLLTFAALAGMYSAIEQGSFGYTGHADTR